MITTLFVESEDPLICAAGMPVCGGKLTGVYFGDLRGHPWHSLNDCFPPDMEAVVLVVQYGRRQGCESVIWVMRGCSWMKRPEPVLKMKTVR